VFDHVGIRVTDRAASERFYLTVLEPLGIEQTSSTDPYAEWDDFAIGPVDGDHPLTRGLHVGFVARSREDVDAFWRVGVDAGYRSDGEPGERPEYAPDYYGAFLLDPDGNSIEAVHGSWVGPPGNIDHLWLRTADVAAARRFYATIAPFAGLRMGADTPDRIQFRTRSSSFSLVSGEPLTENIHIAFPADDNATIHAFHAAALDAGYRDHGGPGERPVYHPGYYGAFVLDPDGNNIEVVNHNE
jgi:catechol 2,3-dioxygenase-like lactoylglutathione lyase family enzyme